MGRRGGEDGDWRAGFRRDGFAVFRQLCPEPAVRRARAAIDRDIAANYDPQRQIEYDHRSYCPDLTRGRPVMALLRQTGIRARLDEVIGFGRLDYDCGQIALRRASNAAAPSPPEPHIDGLPTPFNGVPQDGKFHNFTVLVGVYLSPVRCEFAGNFTVWPMSHHVLEQHFREAGPTALANGMPEIPWASRCR